VLPYTDEFDLIKAAQSAYACVSMSFHGCILCMFGGCPAIPLSSGSYYDHKYVGFADYNPALPIPVIYTAKKMEDKQLDQVFHYFENYDIEPVNAERLRSHQLIDAYYHSIVSKFGLQKV
jgi:hypothetical protein